MQHGFDPPLFVPEPQPAEKPVVGRQGALNPITGLINRWRKPICGDASLFASTDEPFVVMDATTGEVLVPSGTESVSFDIKYEFIDETQMVINLQGSLIVRRARLLWSFPLLLVPELALIVPAREAVPLLSHGDPACPHISRPPPVR